jgi:hypothetical protein
MDYTRKFVEWDVPALSTLNGCKAYQLRERLNNGEKLDRSEKNWQTSNVHWTHWMHQATNGVIGSW